MDKNCVKYTGKSIPKDTMNRQIPDGFGVFVAPYNSLVVPPEYKESWALKVLIEKYGSLENISPEDILKLKAKMSELEQLLNLNKL